jgi:hypothetical protein
MRQVDNIKGGLVVVINDPKKERSDYGGFNERSIWPDSVIQWEQTDKLRYVTQIMPNAASKASFDPIIIKNGLVAVEELDNLLKYRKSLNEKSRLLYLQFADFVNIPNVVQNDFIFLGYDYGNYISEDNYYSVIFNEITFGQGQHETLREYTKYLNKNLLFSSLDHISALEKTRIELRMGGAHLEDEYQGEEFQPIAVYEYKENN